MALLLTQSTLRGAPVVLQLGAAHVPSGRSDVGAVSDDVAVMDASWCWFS